MSDTEQKTFQPTAEPQAQGREDAAATDLTPNLPPAPQTAQNRGEDALDVALQGSMITSDPPSSLMPEEED